MLVSVTVCPSQKISPLMSLELNLLKRNASPSISKCNSAGLRPRPVCTQPFTLASGGSRNWYDSSKRAVFGPIAFATAIGSSRLTALVRYSLLVRVSKPSASTVASPSGRRTTALVMLRKPLANETSAAKPSTCCARKVKFVTATEARKPVRSRSRQRPHTCPLITGDVSNEK